MRGLVVTLLVVFGFTAAAAQGWPALPSAGFISGRPAVEKDVADGNAIFVVKVRGVRIGKPIGIVIPQYAYLVENGRKPMPVVVV